MGFTEQGVFYPDDSSPIADLQDHLQQMAESIDTGLGGAAARVRRAAIQSIPQNLTTAILWDNTSFSRGGAITSSAGIQVPTDGLYSISAQVALNNTASTGFIHIAVTGASYGATVIARGPFSPTAGTVINGATVLSATAGNIISIGVFHTNGGTRDTYDTAYETALVVRWAGSTT